MELTRAERNGARAIRRGRSHYENAREMAQARFPTGRARYHENVFLCVCVRARARARNKSRGDKRTVQTEYFREPGGETEWQ